MIALSPSPTLLSLKQTPLLNQDCHSRVQPLPVPTTHLHSTSTGPSLQGRARDDFYPALLEVTIIVTSSASPPTWQEKGRMRALHWSNNHTLDKPWALRRLHWAELPAHQVGGSLSCPRRSAWGQEYGLLPLGLRVCLPSGHLCTLCTTLPGAREVT